jgi:hypothetical protein
MTARNACHHYLARIFATTGAGANLGNDPGPTAWAYYDPRFHADHLACRRLLPASLHDNRTGA